jgi:hypothetical protein
VEHARIGVRLVSRKPEHTNVGVLESRTTGSESLISSVVARDPVHVDRLFGTVDRSLDLLIGILGGDQLTSQASQSFSKQRVLGFSIGRVISSPNVDRRADTAVFFIGCDILI